MINVGDAAGMVSLAAIIATFVVFTMLVLRVHTMRSFQFQMFVFIVLVVVAEVPYVLSSLGYIQVTPSVQTLGLAFHSVAMTSLAVFILLRTFRIYRER